MSDLAHCSSLKSFSLLLISGEIGFIGVMPVSEYTTYEDFISFFGNIKNNKNANDENCCFFYKTTYKRFDVDSKKDKIFVLEILKKINAINSSIGAVDNIAIRLNVNIIFEAIGKILNSEDDYFEVLEELWKTFIENKECYGENFEKIKQKKLSDLKRAFELSNERIEKLKTIT